MGNAFKATRPLMEVGAIDFLGAAISGLLVRWRSICPGLPVTRGGCRLRRNETLSSLDGARLHLHLYLSPFFSRRFARFQTGDR